jgi:hypothetical protein
LKSAQRTEGDHLVIWSALVIIKTSQFLYARHTMPR